MSIARVYVFTITFLAHTRGLSVMDVSPLSYRFVSNIGSGSSGKVDRYELDALRIPVAVKTVRYVPPVSVEIDVMLHLRGLPNIIQLFDVLVGPYDVHLVMEYADHGDLFQLVEKRGRFDEKTSRAVFRSVLTALHHAHSVKVVHRDIKLENILISMDGTAKLCDWGLSAFFCDDDDVITRCGTQPYMAPETLAGSRHHAPTVDVWAVGVVLYTMVTGHHPFDTTEEISKGLYAPPPVSSSLKHLFSRIFVLDPSRRITVDRILTHPWVSSVLL